MENRDKAFIVGMIFLISIIVPYYILFQGEFVSNQVDEDEEDSSEEIIEQTEGFDYISQISFLKGDNYGANSKSELNSVDGNIFEIIGDFAVGIGYELDVVFEINHDLDSLALDYYDIYLYGSILSSINSELATLQAETTFEWINIANITNKPINITRYYLERCFRFRINATTSAPKVIRIEQLVVFLTHKGDLSPVIPLKTNSYQVKSPYIEGVQGHFEEYGIESGVPGGNPGTTQYSEYAYWWEEPYSTSSAIYQRAEVHHDGYTRGYAKTDLIVDLYLDQADYYEIDPSSYFEIRGKLDFYSAGGDVWWQYYEASIWNYNTLAWENIQSIPHTDFIMRWDKNNLVAPLEDYIDENNMEYKVRFRNGMQRGQYYSTLNVDIKLYLYGSNTSIFVKGYNFDNFDYPNITSIYTIPASPITIQAFDIRADATAIIPSTNIIESRCFISNGTLSSGWLDMDKIPLTNTWKRTLSFLDYANDNYTVMISILDNEGRKTYSFGNFETFNQRPTITFNTPASENEKIIQLTPYTINATILDNEGEQYWLEATPQVKFYVIGDELNPLIDWTDMDNPNDPFDWIYPINPIDYENGFYIIKIRAKDQIGWGYNQITIQIQNLPPDIEIISPSLTELKLPYQQKIICNITNEDPINSAQWDLVNILGNYNWKNLTYNITSEFYEANFSLLDYEYGDYFLVINATDDKYNSSFEIKSLQLHPFFTYNIPEISIVYKNSGITITQDEEQSTDITAQFIIDHHPIAKERDWEIYLPNNFNDAFDYYITRGFNTYYPSGFEIEGIYTLWHIPNYASHDTVHLQLEKPRLSNDISGVLEREDGRFELEFTLSAKHYFSDLTIKHQLTQYFAHPENFEYILEYKFQGEWINYSGDLEVDAGAFINFEFAWGSIDSNSTVEFRFSAIPLVIQETNLTAWFIFGGVASAIGAVVWVLFAGIAFKKYQDWGTAKFILYSVIVIGGAFGAGFGIGLLAYPNPV